MMNVEVTVGECRRQVRVVFSSFSDLYFCARLEELVIASRRVTSASIHYHIFKELLVLLSMS